MPFPEHTLHTHVPEERADEFLAENGGTIEDEYRNLIVAAIHARKPRNFLEVGTGAASALWFRACNQVGSKFWAVEPSQQFLDDLAWMRPKGANLFFGPLAKNLKDLPSTPFEMVLIDSQLERRAEELRALINHGIIAPGTLIFIHDTSGLRTIPGPHGPIPDAASKQFWDSFFAVCKEGCIDWVHFPLSRGLTLAQVRP